mmetsp:Transcript_63665/g.169167  ORF Transcript_63665/g.169167 Transcript_63665/m.169167 type:complete len:227 (+) Transcript_63665:2-682(+)
MPRCSTIRPPRSVVRAPLRGALPSWRRQATEAAERPRQRGAPASTPGRSPLPTRQPRPRELHSHAASVQALMIDPKAPKVAPDGSFSKFFAAGVLACMDGPANLSAVCSARLFAPLISHFKDSTSTRVAGPRSCKQPCTKSSRETRPVRSASRILNSFHVCFASMSRALNQDCTFGLISWFWSSAAVRPVLIASGSLCISRKSNFKRSAYMCLSLSWASMVRSKSC